MNESLAPRMAWALRCDGRVQLIDLRGRHEAGVPRIPDTHAIALDELASEVSTLDRERPVILISGSGRMAAEAVRMFRAAGMTACAVEGGRRAWIQAGLPIERGASAAHPPQEPSPYTG